jgi:lysine N6-hydroxylase
VQLHDKTLYCQNLSLGTGKNPKIPLWAIGVPGEYCFHANEVALRQPDMTNKRVVIIGGGQSGAEIFLNTLNKTWGSCAQLTWVSRRSNLEPLDETPFTNEYFAPKFQQRFFDLPVATKKHLLASQKLASDGISPETLKDIYQALYQREVANQCRTDVSILTGTEVTGLKQAAKSLSVHTNSLLDSGQSSVPADLVILCTGYQYQLPACFAPLAERLNSDAHYGLDMDKRYRTRWDGPEENRIYGMNAGLLSHGIADPQMSINAVRAATITNDLSGVEIYPLRGQSYLQWSHSVSQKSTAAA